MENKKTAVLGVGAGGECAESPRIRTFAAKRAAISGCTTNFKVTYTDFHVIAARRMKRRQEERSVISFRRTGQLYFEKCYTEAVRPWFQRKAISREGIVNVCRIRSNHYNLQVSLYRKGMTSSPDCSCGMGQQDVNHVTFYCPDTAEKTKYLRSYLKKHFPYAPINIYDTIRNPSDRFCRLITAFLKSCNLNI